MDHPSTFLIFSTHNAWVVCIITTMEWLNKKEEFHSDNCIRNLYICKCFYCTIIGQVSRYNFDIFSLLHSHPLLRSEDYICYSSFMAKVSHNVQRRIGKMIFLFCPFDNQKGRLIRYEKVRCTWTFSLK